jgi:hypothetical protein
VKGVRSASGQPITFTIAVQDPFAKTVLAPAANWVTVFLNVDVDANVDYVGTIKKTGTTLSVFFRGQGQQLRGPPGASSEPQDDAVHRAGWSAARTERSGFDDRAVAPREYDDVQHGLPGRCSEQLRLDHALS